MINSIYEHIYEAQREAMIRGIEVDAVAINDKLYYTKLSNGYDDIPMICGLKCVYTNELPEDTMFAVFKSAGAVMTKDEMIAKLQDEKKALNDELERVYALIGRMIDR